MNTSNHLKNILKTSALTHSHTKNICQLGEVIDPIVYGDMKSVNRVVKSKLNEFIKRKFNQKISLVDDKKWIV